MCVGRGLRDRPAGHEHFVAKRDERTARFEYGEKPVGLIKRFKTVREAEKRKKREADEKIDVDELDDFSLDAGDNLEAEIMAELEDAENKGRKG